MGLEHWMDRSSEKFPENESIRLLVQTTVAVRLMLQLRRECIARDGIDGNETVVIHFGTVWG